MEAMIDTAVHIGIPREIAKTLVANTVKVWFYLVVYLLKQLMRFLLGQCNVCNAKR